LRKGGGKTPYMKKKKKKKEKKKKKIEKGGYIQEHRVISFDKEGRTQTET